MFDESLGEISTVTRHIDLKPGSRPAFQRPYQPGIKMGEREGLEIDRMLKEGVLEPAMLERASLVVLFSKKFGKVRACDDYRKLSAMGVRGTYHLPQMDECIDSL